MQDSALKQLPPVFRHADTTRLGISKRQIYSWRDEGVIETLGRGIFMKADADGDPDLIEIAARAPAATLCLRTALVRHGLTDQIPGSTHVAIERGNRPPRTSAIVTWHRFDASTFAVDRAEIKVCHGYTLGLYGPKRTIIDTFRLRHIEGHDMAIDALKRWLQDRSSQPSALLAMARLFPGTEKSIRTALEVLL